MRAIKRVVDFGAGVAIGAVAGAGVAYLAAPKSGADLRKEGQDLVDSAIHAGERARIDRETELRDKFRVQVDRRDALAAPADESELTTEYANTTVPFPS
ncbi:MAG: YtxH domain-containing protein [Thermomicrobiales bacterium]|nr:YtxH domain-containing protein [Thermomicrobiales bacterium]